MPCQKDVLYCKRKIFYCTYYCNITGFKMAGEMIIVTHAVPQDSTMNKWYKVPFLCLKLFNTNCSSSELLWAIIYQLFLHVICNSKIPFNANINICTLTITTCSIWRNINTFLVETWLILVSTFNSNNIADGITAQC